MKKKILVLTSFVVIVCNLQAQDLIVTSSGDSINCKITETTKEYTYFTFKHNEEIRNTLLPVNQIATQQKNYYSASDLLSNRNHKETLPRFRLAIDGGWQYRTAKLVKELDASLRNRYKKSGFHYDLQAEYFFTEIMGFGAMFSQQFFGNNFGYGKLTDMDGNIIGAGKFKEKTSFTYIGANYLIRLFDAKNENSWLLSFGLGYIDYNDRFLFDNVENLKITAGTVGSNWTIGYDIGSPNNFALGFKLSLMNGAFMSFKKTQNGITTNETTPKNSAEGLGTIKLSVGLRFNK